LDRRCLHSNALIALTVYAKLNNRPILERSAKLYRAMVAQLGFQISSVAMMLKGSDRLEVGYGTVTNYGTMVLQ